MEDLLTRPSTRVLLLRGGRTGAVGQRLGLFEPRDVAHLPADDHLFLGEADGVAYLARVVPERPRDAHGVAGEAVAPAEGTDDPSDAPVGAVEEAGPEGFGWLGLREVSEHATDLELGLAIEAVALAAWLAVSGHCPRCGEPTELAQAGWVRRCTAEGIDHYPRTDPAVIMAIVDADDRLLLGRGPQWAPGRYSVLAGFVEPGESAEHAVRREVLEETAVEVADVHYAGSQSWPFPASLMLGYRGRAVTTDLRCDPEELADARWFTRDELGAAVTAGDLGLPGRASIARSLIEEWYGTEIAD